MKAFCFIVHMLTGFYTTIHNKLHFVLVAYDMHVCNFNNLNESVLFYCAYADS